MRHLVNMLRCSCHRNAAAKRWTGCVRKCAYDSTQGSSLESFDIIGEGKFDEYCENTRILCASLFYNINYIVITPRVT